MTGALRPAAYTCCMVLSCISITVGSWLTITLFRLIDIVLLLVAQVIDLTCSSWAGDMPPLLSSVPCRCNHVLPADSNIIWIHIYSLQSHQRLIHYLGAGLQSCLPQKAGAWSNTAQKVSWRWLEARVFMHRYEKHPPFRCPKSERGGDHYHFQPYFSLLAAYTWDANTGYSWF